MADYQQTERIAVSVTPERKRAYEVEAQLRGISVQELIRGLLDDVVEVLSDDHLDEMSCPDGLLRDGKAYHCSLQVGHTCRHRDITTTSGDDSSVAVSVASWPLTPSPFGGAS